ncbi:MAG TPA: 2-oxo acid dehydrogenase subunit E2 [Phycisphaerales bacterium]|nr:2-oxo acid dehydrogenase subunit E2 [Phycisphaerales bacterium]
MAKEVRLPQLGQTMEEGTIVDCTVKVGDKVSKGDVIFEIETDKATLEMESPGEGFVKAILVEAGQTIPVGDPVMVLGDKDETVPQSFIDSLKGGAPKAAAAAPAAAAAAQAVTPAAEPTAATPGKVIASPRAKKLAADLGVNIATVKGSGPGGRITEEDVQAASRSTGILPVAEARITGEGGMAGQRTGKDARDTQARLGSTVAVNRLQKLTAERMLKSKLEIPCFYLNVKVDMTDLVALRTRYNESGKGKVSFNDFLIRAVALGLDKFPIMTGQLAGDKIKLAERIHVGLAISVPDGLVAPLIKDADKKDVPTIAKDALALIDRARADKLSLDDLEGGCITVSNLGGFGIESFTPIVVPGQCSILGVGKITDTCVPDNGNILVRKLMSLTLSVDHKVANGAYAAQFLDFVRKQLEDAASFGL